MTVRGVRLWRPRTVRAQLVLGVCGVVSLALMAVGAVTVLSLRSYLTSMVDAEVSASLAAFTHSYNRHADGPTAPGQPPNAKALTAFTGQGPGNLIALMRNGVVVGSAQFSDNEPRPAPADATRAIEAQTWTAGPPRTLTLGSLGRYRVQSLEAGGGQRLISAVSMARFDSIVARKSLTTAGLLLVALVATAISGALVVRAALQPLRRVVATAGRVAKLSLSGQNPRIKVRVRDHDTDRANEIGIVGDTLNRLLDNVDGALVQRAETDRRMRQFFTDASHELRTPLAAIQGYAELTRQDSAVLPPMTEYALARIESEAHRLTGLVDELLLLSRLDEGQDLQSDVVDLGDVVIDAVNDASVAAAGPGTHNWQTALPDGPVYVRGDRARLHQLVSNLLSNARIHTPPGVTVTTGITVHAGSRQAELTVADDGPGIDPELLPHMFERFVRADKARARELGSTGLGLSIVASIVEAHHGSVTAESAGGQTVFRIRLPLLDGAAAGAQPHPSAAR